MELELPSLHSPNKLIADAVRDYINDGSEKHIQTWIDGRKDENYTASYFLRTLSDMPEYEKKALSLVNGKTLDIGAGAGAHSKVLSEKSENVTALELESQFIELLKQIPNINVISQDFFRWKTPQKYDTILLLMNGFGIAQSIERFPLMMDKLKKLKTNNGKILVEITDYKFSPEYDSKIMKNPQVMFRLKYGHKFSTEMPWLYPSLEMVKAECKRVSLQMSILYSLEETFLLELS